VARKKKDSKLIKPIDIKRHQQFQRDVDDLMHYGHMRHYTAEIYAKTQESKGNISDYYHAQKPISNNFLKKFKKAYSRILKRIREKNRRADLPIASKNTRARSNPIDLKEQLPKTDTDVPIEDVGYYSDFEKIVMEKLIGIEERLARLEQKMDTPPDTPPQKD
jgi:hypothetical protein